MESYIFSIVVKPPGPSLWPCVNHTSVKPKTLRQISHHAMVKGVTGVFLFTLRHLGPFQVTWKQSSSTTLMLSFHAIGFGGWGEVRHAGPHWGPKMYFVILYLVIAPVFPHSIHKGWSRQSFETRVPLALQQRSSPILAWESPTSVLKIQTRKQISLRVTQVWRCFVPKKILISSALPSSWNSKGSHSLKNEAHKAHVHSTLWLCLPTLFSVTLSNSFLLA